MRTFSGAEEFKKLSDAVIGSYSKLFPVVGKDGVGIIAKVCNYLASNNVNILDISQTITGGFFNMMMVVDPAGSSKDIALLSSELKQIGEEIGVVIQAQNERIFDIMHRI